MLREFFKQTQKHSISFIRILLEIYNLSKFSKPLNPATTLLPFPFQCTQVPKIPETDCYVVRTWPIWEMPFPTYHQNIKFLCKTSAKQRVVVVFSLVYIRFGNLWQQLQPRVVKAYGTRITTQRWILRWWKDSRSKTQVSWESFIIRRFPFPWNRIAVYGMIKSVGLVWSD